MSCLHVVNLEKWTCCTVNTLCESFCEEHAGSIRYKSFYKYMNHLIYDWTMWHFNDEQNFCSSLQIFVCFYLLECVPQFRTAVIYRKYHCVLSKVSVFTRVIKSLLNSKYEILSCTHVLFDEFRNFILK